MDQFVSLKYELENIGNNNSTDVAINMSVTMTDPGKWFFIVIGQCSAG